MTAIYIYPLIRSVKRTNCLLDCSRRLTENSKPTPGAQRHTAAEYNPTSSRAPLSSEPRGPSCKPTSGDAAPTETRSGSPLLENHRCDGLCARDWLAETLP